ncbi:MAG: hypothetical protein LBD60_00420 [Puniceicoccales bacterium]|nr:hypothetical protein [Puniceicoccales bacterium]
MNTEALQMGVIATMVMGNVMTSVSSKGEVPTQTLKRDCGAILQSQQNAGDRFNRLQMKELVAGSEGSGISSLVSKLCVILGCERRDIGVYRFVGKRGAKGGESLNRNETLSLIFKLIQLKKGARVYLSPKDFIERDLSAAVRSQEHQYDWGGADRDGVVACFLPKTKEQQFNDNFLFDQVAFISGLSVFVIDSVPGWFKSFHERLRLYNGINKCKPTEVFACDIQRLLREGGTFWKNGAIWLFAICLEDIYIVCPKESVEWGNNWK